MRNFSIENFGCRATDADAAAVRAGLGEHGLEVVSGHDRADIVVLNTCTVTAAADSQARETIRKIHRVNPAARILVTGCYAQRAPEELAGLDGVAWVVGNSHRVEIPRLVCEGMALQGADFVPASRLAPVVKVPAKILTGDIFDERGFPADGVVPASGDRTRPIFKIQDGCNNRCSYCVIPFVRGRSRSLPPNDVVWGVRALTGRTSSGQTARGAREVVLSGINLGSYGRDLAPRASLAELVDRIIGETDLERLRFSSIEPQDVTEDFVRLVASSGRIAPHFHVPLQSGSDAVLSAMHRWYRGAHYAERIQLIHRLLQGAAIGADVIAGFPGETPDDFQATVEFIERLPFTYLHVFSFSARPGTAGAELRSTVPEAVIHERARTLRQLGQRKAAEFRHSQNGAALRALTLARSGDDWTEALTGNYLKVRIAGCHAANEWREVQLDGNADTVVPSVSLSATARERTLAAEASGVKTPEVCATVRHG
jgi:threonylcarbamoyladenosine tRNA methylthiotransferase MtaB